MKYTEPAKLKLRLAIDVLQRYGRAGTVILDQLLKERPVDEGTDREEVLMEVGRRYEKAKDVVKR